MRSDSEAMEKGAWRRCEEGTCSEQEAEEEDDSMADRDSIAPSEQTEVVLDHATAACQYGMKISKEEEDVSR